MLRLACVAAVLLALTSEGQAQTDAPRTRSLCGELPANAERRDYSPWKEWRADVLRHLDRFKRYPVNRQEGVACVFFVLSRDGRVVSSKIYKSARSGQLDAEALNMLERAQPLPPPPLESQETIEVLLPINFYRR
jgi:TonB family protein